MSNRRLGLTSNQSQCYETKTILDKRDWNSIFEREKNAFGVFFSASETICSPFHIIPLLLLQHDTGYGIQYESDPIRTIHVSESETVLRVVGCLKMGITEMNTQVINVKNGSKLLLFDA